VADDIVTRLQCIYNKDGCGQCTFCLAKAEIERLRALADQLAEALREVSEVTKVLHGRGDLADCLIQSFTTLTAYEAARKEADRG
jgi:hypothetical protein